MKTFLRDLFTRNGLLKLVSLIIAFLLWGFLMLEKKSEVALSVPIRVENMPPGLVMTEPPPTDLRVVVRGRRTQISAIDERVLPYLVDLKGVSRGVSSFDVIPTKIDLPRGLQIAHVSPSQFTLKLSPVISRTLPVTARFRGQMPEGYKLVMHEVQPAEVRLSGAKEELEDLKTIDTIPINLAPLRGDLQLDADLDLSALHLIDVTTHVVEVFLDVEEVITERVFKQVPVAVPSGAASVAPATITVTIRGPMPVLNELTAADIQASANLPRRGRRAKIEIVAPVRSNVVRVRPAFVEVSR